MNRRARPRAWLHALGIAAAVALTDCATTNVVLRRRPDADTGALGPFARCEPGQTPCRDDPDYDSSRFNLSHTALFSLPNCAYGVHEILIQNAGSSDAVAIVRCAAPAPEADTLGTLPITEPGGTTSPTP